MGLARFVGRRQKGQARLPLEKYTVDELVVLTHKITYCFYSWNQLVSFSDKNRLALKQGTEPELANELIEEYYKNHFMHEFSELYTYFYKHEDQTILDKFLVTEESRRKLKELRHKIAHIDRSLDKNLKTQEEFMGSVTSIELIKDLVTMLQHTRALLRLVKGEHTLVDHLRAILSIYPSDFVHETTRKALLE